MSNCLFNLLSFSSRSLKTKFKEHYRICSYSSVFLLNYRRSYSNAGIDSFKKHSNSKFFKENQRDIMIKMINSASQINDSVISDIRKNVLSSGNEINENNFDAVFLEICIKTNAFVDGRLYFNILRENNKLNVAIIRKFFKLCYLNKDLCTEEDKRIILSLYKELTTKYPMFDVKTYESIICGLSITHLWKDALNILKAACELEAPTSTMYSAIIEAAFLNGESKLGWKLMEELSDTGNKPKKSVYSSLLSRKCNEETLDELLLHISKYSIVPSEDVACLIRDVHSRIRNVTRSGNFTNISEKGICQNCKTRLQPVTINIEEFKKLTDKFLKPVLIGKDVFLKSRPSEIESYLKYLSHTGKVDVVLDGLNIAYASGARKSSSLVFSRMLKHVVAHFVLKNMKVMVIGRKHMLSWPKMNMDYILNNSSVFLADNMSSDDPLLLYAAMYNGLGTIFVSRDTMRGHKFLLKESQLRQIFLKWQQKHQYHLKHVSNHGHVILQAPLPYLQDAHCTNNIWHIPVNAGDQPGTPPHLRHAGQTWLCLH